MEASAAVDGLDFTVVIPAWNTRELLLAVVGDLLPGIPGARIVVVDDASTDGSATAVTTAFPEVTLLRNAENLGFAASVNRGLQRVLAQASRPAAVILLNADTRGAAAVLPALARRLGEQPAVAALAPRLELPDGRGQPYAFGDDPSPAYLLRRGWNRLLRRRPLHDWEESATRFVDWVSFACVALRTAAIVQTGLLDPEFFMYFEDNDWCLRARRLGWGVLRCPDLSLCHLGGASLSQSPVARRAYRLSLRRFARKHYHPTQAMLVGMLLPFYAALADRGRQRREA